MLRGEIEAAKEEGRRKKEEVKSQK